MTTTAIITMIIAWTIIISLALYFFIKVLRKPFRKEDKKPSDQEQ
jgi:hypothetical protein